MSKLVSEATADTIASKETIIEAYKIEYIGLDYLFDEENYVDSEISLCKFEEDIVDSEDYEGKVQIWTHLDANKSRDFYFKYQDWWW